jgi:hypothetical protein
MSIARVGVLIVCWLSIFGALKTENEKNRWTLTVVAIVTAILSYFLE